MKHRQVMYMSDEVLSVLAEATRTGADHGYRFSQAPADAGNSHRIRTLVTGIYIGVAMAIQLSNRVSQSDFGALVGVSRQAIGDMISKRHS